MVAMAGIQVGRSFVFSGCILSSAAASLLMRTPFDDLIVISLQSSVAILKQEKWTRVAVCSFNRFDMTALENGGISSPVSVFIVIKYPECYALCYTTEVEKRLKAEFS